MSVGVSLYASSWRILINTFVKDIIKNQYCHPYFLFPQNKNISFSFSDSIISSRLRSSLEEIVLLKARHFVFFEKLIIFIFLENSEENVYETISTINVMCKTKNTYHNRHIQYFYTYIKLNIYTNVIGNGLQWEFDLSSASTAGLSGLRIKTASLTGTSSKVQAKVNL